MSSLIRTTVVVLFADRAGADRGVAALRQAGFEEDQIGVALRHPTRTEVGDVPAKVTDNVDDAAGIGALAGASLGGLAGGTLLGMLSGGLVGGLVGAFIGLGVPEDEARYYQQELEAGHTIVTVQTSERYEEALEILLRHGGREATPPSADAGVGVLP